MQIGDTVIFRGKKYVLRGFEPMSVHNRRADLEDPDTGERVYVPLEEVEPAGLSRGRGAIMASMQEMVIYGVSFDMVGKTPIVLLKTADGNKFLPIWIGHPEAAAILMKLQGASTPRPMTHDLVTDILGQLEANVVRITVTELRENTFYAEITVQQNGTEIQIDSRPSDAIALAIRAEAPIYAADDVIEESAIEFAEGEEVNEEEMVAEFKRFLDRVTPEEFALEDEEEG